MREPLIKYILLSPLYIYLARSLSLIIITRQLAQQMTEIKEDYTNKKIHLRTAIKIIAGLMVAIALWSWWSLGQGQQQLTTMIVWIGAQGVIGAVVYVALYVVAALCFIPGSALTLAAGMLYGLWRGLALVSLASVLGAAAAFGMARLWSAPFIKLRDRYRWLEALERVIVDHPLKITLLTRLSPIFPYNVLNYALGLTKMPWSTYLLASWAGMLPGTLLYVYLGTTMRALTLEQASSTSATTSASTAQTALTWIGLIISVGLTLWITRKAQAQLKATLAQADEAPSDAP